MSETNGKKIVKAGLGYTIGNYLLKGLTFLTLPIFSRLMSTADYGIYNIYIAYEAIVCILVGLALHSSIKSAKGRYEKGFEKYLSSCLLLMLFSLATWLILVNVFETGLSELLGFDRLVLCLLILQSFGSGVIQFYNVYVGLEYKYKDFLKISGLNAVLNIGISIVLMLTVYTQNRSLARIMGSALPVILISAYVLVFFFKKAKPRISKMYWGYAIRYSLPVIPHGISQILLSQFDRIMIKNMVGESEAGIYSFAYTIYTIVAVTGSSLDNVWGPWFYEKMKAKDYESIRRQSGRYLIGMFLFTAILVLVSPEIILILGGKKYVESIYCVIPLVVGGFFSFAYLLPAYVEYYYEKTKYIAIGTCSAAIINMVLNWIFITKYGYISAAYATFITFVLYFVFHYFMARKIHGAFLFSNKVVVLLGAGMIILNVVTLVVLDYAIVRWLLALGVGIISIILAQKVFNIKKFFLKRK